MRLRPFALLALLAAPLWAGAEFNGTTQYLTGAPPPTTAATPLSFTALIKPDTTGTNLGIWSMTDIGSTLEWREQRRHNTNVTQMASRGPGDSSAAIARSVTATTSANTWHTSTVSEASATSRAAWLDGGNKGTDTSTVTAQTGVDTFYIGAINTGVSGPGTFFDGTIFGVAAWEIALSDDEVAILGDRFSPLLVRPGSLVAYFPLLRGDYTDKVSGTALTATGSPTEDSDNPRVFLWY